MPQEEWLELNEAAQIIGVHPSTLRRWADAGKVQHIRTLSGRRRFTREKLEEALNAMQVSSPEQVADQLEEKTLDLARERTSDLSSGSETWMPQLNEEQRLLFRYSGQRLLGLLIQYISRNGPNETFLEEGKRVARDYGRICSRAGMTVTQTAEAFLYFRRSILESVQVTSRMSGPNDEDSHRVFLRTVDFFDDLLVATIESFTEINQITV